jgi:hypothetical protein
MSFAARQRIRQAGAWCAALARGACVLLLLAAMTLTSVSGHAAHATATPGTFHATAVDDGDNDQPELGAVDCSAHSGCHAATLPDLILGPEAVAASIGVPPTLIRLSGRVGPPLPHPPDIS